eukprot:11392951-Alexandrium_andersonii.AAC.1
MTECCGAHMTGTSAFTCWVCWRRRCKRHAPRRRWGCTHPLLGSVALHPAQLPRQVRSQCGGALGRSYETKNNRLQNTAWQTT